MPSRRSMRIVWPSTTTAFRARSLWRYVADLRQLHDRFSALYTGAIADVLDRRGHLRQTLPPPLRPLRDGMRLAGPAYPVEGRPAPSVDYDASIRATLQMLGTVPAGHVAVYQTHDPDSATNGA